MIIATGLSDVIFCANLNQSISWFFVAGRLLFHFQLGINFNQHGIPFYIFILIMIDCSFLFSKEKHFHQIFAIIKNLIVIPHRKFMKNSKYGIFIGIYQVEGKVEAGKNLPLTDIGKYLVCFLIQ
jgi:hypothetical protein